MNHKEVNGSSAEEAPMTKLDFIISEISLDDVEAIENMRFQSWLDTYPNEEFGFTAEMIKERFADKLSPEGLERKRQEYAKNLNDPNFLQLAVKDDFGKIVGALVAVKDDKEGYEVDMIYTDKSVHGTGVGGTLMDRAMDWFGDDEDVLVEVASYNERAKAFYRKYGFAEVGEPRILNVPNMPLQKMIRRGAGGR